MIIVSIDVGLCNVGFAVYDHQRRKFIHVARLAIVSKLKNLTNHDEIIPRAFKNIFAHPKYGYIFRKADVVLIERQMKTIQKIIQNIIATICFMQKIKYHIVSPVSVKTMFNTVCRDHEYNKQAAIKTVRALEPDVFNSLEKGKVDDICDAMLQALWWSNLTRGVKKVENPISEDLQRREKVATTKKRKTTKKKTRRSKSKTPAKRRKVISSVPWSLHVKPQTYKTSCVVYKWLDYLYKKWVRWGTPEFANEILDRLKRLGGSCKHVDFVSDIVDRSIEISSLWDKLEEDFDF